MILTTLGPAPLTLEAARGVVALYERGEKLHSAPGSTAYDYVAEQLGISHGEAHGRVTEAKRLLSNAPQRE